jgi:hypothetical protein
MASANGKRMNPAKTFSIGCRRTSSEVTTPKLPPAAANSPKQFGILRAVHKYNLAICEHNFRAEQIIERQTESRQKRAVAAPGQQSGQANCAGCSGYCSKPMWAHGSDNVTGQCASYDCRNSASNIHLDLPHPREIHYQPMVAQRPSYPIVPPAAHGQRKTICSSGTHRLLHISRALTEGKQRWPAINCAIENLPRPLVGSLTRDCDLALHYGAQVFCYRDP